MKIHQVRGRYRARSAHRLSFVRPDGLEAPVAEDEDLRFTRIAVASGALDQSQADEVYKVWAESRDARSIGRWFVERALITEPQRKAIAELLRVTLPHGAPGADPAPADGGAVTATPSPQLDPTAGAVQSHPFGRLILQSGWASVTQVNECLELQRTLARTGQPKQLGEIMVEKGYLSVTQIRELLSHQDKEILRCEKCGAKYNVTKLPAGKTVRCIKCGSALTVPARITNPGVEASLHLHTSTDPLIGKVLGGCRIEHKLGQGGMATVYRGTHLGLNKVLAVKVLPPSSAHNPDFTDRFLREARAAAKIEHANIVQVYNVGCEQGYHFILMQFVSGRTLTEVLAEFGMLPADRAQDIVVEAAKGLAVAHQHGIVHRDVKPDNILVTDDGKIKLSDFGLAQEVKNPKGNKADMIAGTPYYMPPEQWEGKTIDSRSDIYSLGITYYYLLSGHKPFSSTDMIILMKMHAKDEPPPPSKWGTSVSEEVWSIIRKMIAKKPDDRYQTAEEFLKDMDRMRQSLQPLAMQSLGGLTVECSFCNALNPEGAGRCSVCGEGLGADSGDLELGLRADEFYCPKCKTPNQAGAEQCESCHAGFCRACQTQIAVVRGMCKPCATANPPQEGGGPKRARR